MRFAAWVPLVGIVLGLGCAGTAIAQEAPSQPPQAPLGAVEPAPAPSKSMYQSLKSYGSFGMSAGLMRFVADQDARVDAMVRPSLQGVFRYRFSDDVIGVAEFGFGWNAYKDRGDTVLAVTSGTFGLYKHFADAIGFDWRYGGGLGIYRWNYKFNGRSIRDLQSNLFYVGFAPGIFAGFEAEHRLTAHAAVLLTEQNHFLFSSSKSDHPTMFGGNDAFMTVRIGVNYHFSPNEGILWEKKVSRKIRLTSGKAGQ